MLNWYAGCLAKEGSYDFTAEYCLAETNSLLIQVSVVHTARVGLQRWGWRGRGRGPVDWALLRLLICLTSCHIFLILAIANNAVWYIDWFLLTHGLLSISLHKTIFYNSHQITCLFYWWRACLSSCPPNISHLDTDKMFKSEVGYRCIVNMKNCMTLFSFCDDCHQKKLSGVMQFWCTT